MHLPQKTPTFLQNTWEEYAICYDSLLKLKPYTDTLAHVVRDIPHTHTKPILDASCGTGNFEQALMMSDNHKHIDVIGVDMSQEMLARAKKKHEESPNLVFLEADLNKPLPFKERSMSQVVSINTIYAVTSPEKTLHEFFRVLEPGGQLFLVTPQEGFENGMILKEHCCSELPDEYWHDAHQTPEKEEKLIREALHDEKTIQSMLTVARHNRNIAHNHQFHFFKQEELLKLLTNIGFSIVQTSLTYAKQDIYITAKKGI
jgi:ubiquinone/menaquinone biosynthesis C-methylase UbiE